MKPSLLLLLALLCSIPTIHSQLIDSTKTLSNQEMYDFYKEREHKQKKTGYILLAAGGGAMLTGILIAASSNDLDRIGSGGLVMTAGILSTLTSVPFFIIASGNKKKAEFLLSTGNLGLQGLPKYQSSYAAVGFKISF